MSDITKITSGSTISKSIMTTKSGSASAYYIINTTGTKGFAGFIDINNIRDKYQSTFKHQQPPYSG